MGSSTELSVSRGLGERNYFNAKKQVQGGSIVVKEIIYVIVILETETKQLHLHRCRVKSEVVELPCTLQFSSSKNHLPNLLRLWNQYRIEHDFPEWVVNGTWQFH